MPAPPNESDRLAVDFMPLAMRIAREEAKKGSPLSRDDLEGEALLALVQAARQFDPSGARDVRAMFARYAALCIRRNLLDAIRKENAANGKMDEPLTRGMDKLCTDPTPALKAETRDSADYIRQHLGKKCERPTADELSGKSIMRNLGVCEATASNRKRKARQIIEQIESESYKCN